jgi:phosphate transport system substrate-binding protein
MRLKTSALTIATLLLAALAAACGGGGEGGPVRPGEESGSVGGSALQGAGATFPYPLYSKWISEYNKKTPGVKIDYQSIGSGGGIKQITERTVDFGASDAPMSDDQLKAVAPREIMHIPTVLGAVVVTYNLPELQQPLKLDGPAIANIYFGKIKKWNDPAIAALNPGVTLPASDIAAAHRSDGSGTTNIFVDYLAKVSPEWKEKVGVGTSVNWPSAANAFGGKGNEGVAGFVKQTPGAIGYVELIYAKQNKLPVAHVKNSSGTFVEPSLESVTAAAAGVAETIPEDLRVSVTNAPGAAAYPISGFTYLLVYKDQENAEKGKVLADFIWWALHEGSAMASELTYSPLPSEVLTKAEAKVRAMNSNGTPFIK